MVAFDVSALVPVVPIAGRALYGWAKNSLADGTIQAVEWKKLGNSVLKLGAVAVFVFYGLGGIGFDLTATTSAALAGLVDVAKNDVFEK